ncbi:hypothetical protein LTR37_000102 [Vermiconidia calcicola]|uniref:Uncharacterized protein n=1 Tax=Vermiconidia calcicola TaxID=1690605 RepID=A0ACC3NZE9_9PEZI|nr:hypothetical protein LTR37_000102 [Vermiconidia calcicola]
MTERVPLTQEALLKLAEDTPPLAKDRIFEWIPPPPPLWTTWPFERIEGQTTPSPDATMLWNLWQHAPQAVKDAVLWEGRM